MPDADISHPRRVSDPQALHALAHPVRLGIIELLSIHGPMTATELAHELDETPANCSWHLRKLAEHDFVVEAPGAAGRRRPWQMRRIGFAYEGSDDAETRIAGRGLRRVLAQRFVERYLEATERLEETDPEGLDASFQLETAAYLTHAELGALREEIDRLTRPYQGRLENAEERPEGARLVELVAWGVPIDVLLGRGSGGAR